ncbi:hypothetical protein BKA83DRAFT_4200341 [Pisolithus microcarpus]|nr:hypothetical protein BKA83DRAFT_4200341 [Pisolithus microcarpus]
MAVLDQSPKQLVVLGAGVIGLTIAYLATADPNNSFSVTVVARDMPEDMDSQAWASPFAGANWAPMPMGGIDPRVRRREQVTFDKFWDMIPTGLVKVTASGVRLDQTLHEFQCRNFLPRSTQKLLEAHPSYGGVIWIREFRILPPEEIPEPYVAGVAFCTVSVNPQEYIPWLSSELRARDVEFVRKHVKTLEELRPLYMRLCVGSRSIIGVEDTKLFPIRGQSILVQSPELQEFLATKPDDDAMSAGAHAYIIPRPGRSLADTVLLGGTYEVGNWDTSLDMNIARAIFYLCSELAPSLRNSDQTKILAHNVGLRPAREGGPRVEAEIVQFPLRGENDVLIPWNTTSLEEGKMRVVHAYGFGGAGYQTSWGVAEDVMAIIKEMQACMQ